ncbi:unnamed protein product [Callosobruchus maculatus]|uniref:Uncharacterized protein n=1 Tax=Callosobruchus maculatus TaxID=64391 RepID=A0A653CWZ3_CALMS|nr:unnamed protein product [Callosobruchus maculatus]
MPSARCPITGRLALVEKASYPIHRPRWLASGHLRSRARRTGSVRKVTSARRDPAEQSALQTRTVLATSAVRHRWGCANQSAGKTMIAGMTKSVKDLSAPSVVGVILAVPQMLHVSTTNVWTFAQHQQLVGQTQCVEW